MEQAWWFWLMIQGLGFVGILASLLSFQFRGHKQILFFRSANEFFFGIQYLLLGAYTGMMMNFVGVVRNMVFTHLVQKERNTMPARGIFAALFLVFTAFTWAGPQSILSGGAKVVSTFAYGCKNTTVVRICVLFTASAWLVYNIFVGSVAGCICEGLTLISLMIGILKFDIKKKKEDRTP